MIQLRTAEVEEYKAIAAIHAASWRKTYRGIYSDQFLDNEVEEERLQVWYNRLQSPASNQIITVATVDSGIIGFACLYLNDDVVFGSLIDNLHVAANVQKSGIGKLLIQQCARQVYEKANSRKLYLWVYETNTNARAFYERLGATNFETMEKQNSDGGKALSCRYIWNDVAAIL